MMSRKCAWTCLILLQSARALLLSSDNTCGGSNRYKCNPGDPNGGPCCSSAGFCGNTTAYCGVGCQSMFGTCWDTPAMNRSGEMFTKFVNYTFTGSDLPEGLEISNYKVSDTTNNNRAKFDHSFVPGNVDVSDGFLWLKVPGGQVSNVVTGAEVATTEQDILYSSVRVKAILSGEPGVVNGIFFYHSDCQEIDIEFLPDASSESNLPGQRPGLQYTNQATDCNHEHETHKIMTAPASVSDSVHEYRVDWTVGQVAFYTDDILQSAFTENVPSAAGAWIFNLWTNGDPGFSVGPPQNDAVLKISNIVIYYNTTKSGVKVKLLSCSKWQTS